MNVATVDRLFPGWAKATIRILSKRAGEGYVPLVLNRMQRRQWQRHLASEKPWRLTLKARQMGSTTEYLASHIQRCQMLDGYRVAVYALQKEAGAAPLSQTVREMIDAQPDDYKKAAPRVVAASDEVIRLANGSQIRFFTQAGQNPGRSLTFHRLHFTEYGKWADPGEVRAAAMPALVPDGELDIESTAGGYNDYYDLVQEVRGGPDSPYEFSFYPWWEAEEYVSKQPLHPPSYTPEEQALATEHSLTPQQIAFRRQAIKAVGKLFPQEYAENPDDCFLAMGDSVFDFNHVATLRANCVPPSTVELDGLLSLWHEPHPGVAYVIGADCAMGVSDGDLNAAPVLQASTGRHVATLMDAPPFAASRERRMNPNQFARNLAVTGRRFNQATIAVERNHVGQAVLTALRDIEGYPAEAIARFDGAYGFNTNEATKPALVQSFTQALEVGEFATQDIRVPRQMGDFVVLRRTAFYEKMGARLGAHDDLLMATMIANAARPKAMTAANWGPMLVTVGR